ncbi:MAG: Myo-inositol 2-dehydrogenase / D-chiro-inositol 1-dehydrogenase [Dehalococcoidia bacterium]|nr:Myo-inositol 2-dehydrogenase / D-chiro-inositol 1-dehydrogenase [Dehalococcoidia bacterium]
MQEVSSDKRKALRREFLRGIQEGTSPAPNFYDGFRCQRVLDAVGESSATRQAVQIAMEIKSSEG